MLFQGLDKIKRNVLMATIVFMFVGLVLLLIPEEYFPFVNFCLGFGLSVVFVFSVLSFIGADRSLISYIKLTLGMLVGIFGLAFFIFDGMLLSMLSWLVGILPIILGAYGIYHSLAFARRSGRRAWWILTLLSALLMVFGGFIFWNPWMDASDAFIKIIGGTMLYSSLVSAMSLIWILPIRGSEEE